MKRKNILILMITVVFILNGCQSKSSGAQDKTDVIVTDKETETGLIKPETIYEQFVSENDQTKVKKFKFSLDHKTYLYKVEGFQEALEIETVYDAKTGAVITTETERDHDRDEEITLADIQTATNLLNDAIAEVSQDVEVKSWTVEYDDLRKIFEVEFIDQKNHDFEYKYDLDTKELIEKDY